MLCGLLVTVVVAVTVCATNSVAVTFCVVVVVVVVDGVGIERHLQADEMAELIL